MKLLFIHGRGQHLSEAEDLLGVWTESLERGFHSIGKKIPTGLDIILPYYGDYLHQICFEERKENGIEKGGRLPLSMEDIFIQEVMLEMDPLGQLIDSSSENDSVVIQKGDYIKNTSKKIAKKIDAANQEVGEAVIKRYFKDVYAYLTRSEVRKHMLNLMLEKVDGEEVVIVSHSLGSIVGYDVATSDESTMKVLGMITLGSPLGINPIRRRLSPLENPVIGSWKNYFDRRDFVALHPLDEASFPVSPSIINNDSIINDSENHHNIRQYLEDSEVAQGIWLSISETVNC